MKIALIGGGNMGEAMLSAIGDKGLAAAGDITVSDVSEPRRQYLSRTHGVKVTADNRQAVAAAEVVVLAVKPQHLAEVMAGLKGRLASGQLLLSIVAGARIDTLRAGLGHDRIVRVMPNTPAQIGEGMSVWTATAGVTALQKERAGAILGAMGKQLYVTDEDDIDKATAVSGSGPAYIFYFVEALTAAAEGLGLPPDTAAGLVRQTLAGSAHFLEKSGKEPAELRRMVTSPGGTTAAALARLEEGQFAGLVREAVAAAYRRAKELGG
ncbi:MAG: pyrroline-5-carboxylate reductase [Chloroflexota bacterium]